MKKKIQSFEDLEVYQKLTRLHLEVHEVTLSFPKFEMYELGSQLRRSSNSIPANLAEGRNNNHINLYLEGINRALEELQETRHHLYVAFQKGYLDQLKYEDVVARYAESAKMLFGLQHSLQKFKP
ncbi:MAG: four helix bundle protein [Ignavibacteriae bacterium]|nr:four helix bundle protein [Ignavibacteriota bacterium]